jgi:hypothetical protein
MEEGREKVYRVIFSLPFALNKLIALGQMFRNGEVPLSEIIQNNEEETEEGLQLERERLFEITREIDKLNKKRKLYLQRLEATSSRVSSKSNLKKNEKESNSLIKLLEENRNRILEKIRDLRLKEDVIAVFSDELKKSVAEIDTLQKKIAAIGKKSTASGSSKAKELQSFAEDHKGNLVGMKSGE